MDYRQLQASLKTLKANGADVKVKLNAKQAVLQAEYDRLTVQVEAEVCEGTPTLLQMSASSQRAAKGLPEIEPSVEDIANAERAKRENLAKLANNLAPRHKQKAAAPKKPSVIAEAVKKVACKVSEVTNPYFLSYEAKLTDTEKQAVRNARQAAAQTVQAVSNVVSFAKGFHAAQVERNEKLNARANNVTKNYTANNKVAAPIKRAA